MLNLLSSWDVPLLAKLAIVIIYVVIDIWLVHHSGVLSKLEKSQPHPYHQELRWHYYWRWSKFSWICFAALIVMMIGVSWIAMSPGAKDVALGAFFIFMVLSMMALAGGIGATINAGFYKVTGDQAIYNSSSKKFVSPLSPVKAGSSHRFIQGWLFQKPTAQECQWHFYWRKTLFHLRWFGLGLGLVLGMALMAGKQVPVWMMVSTSIIMILTLIALGGIVINALEAGWRRLQPDQKRYDAERGEFEK